MVASVSHIQSTLNLIVLSQKQHFSGIHMELGKEDALKQHGDEQC
jgi:hypothetical protein